jgi:uncharacterized coiled-coil DUF342 family protein
MFRMSFLPLVFLVVSTPAWGQTNSKDSQTLGALLTEVRQLRQDLEATTLVTHKLQQTQKEESTAQDELRSQQARLERLEADFDRLEKSFETSQVPAKDSQ